MMLKLVWDTSALVNLKEQNRVGFSPANSLWKDLADGWIIGPYRNIIPAISAFEISAAVASKNRQGQKMLHEFYIIGENEIIYAIDEPFIKRSAPLLRLEGFDRLRGADLIFACIAKLEDAMLITLDKGFERVANQIKVINLNESRESPKYRDAFPLRESAS
jgi:predicted nucleic acid-binding protein